MPDINQLLLLCEQMESKGITPSVAMLRAKSPEKIAMPVAVNVIQQYKAGTRANSTIDRQPSIPHQSEQDITIEARVAKLEQQNQQLHIRIKSLELQLANLTNG